MSDVLRLLKVLESADGVEIERGEPIDDLTHFADLIEPHFGMIEWTPPRDYAAVLGAWGAFSATRSIDSDDQRVGIELLDDDEIVEVNEGLVHMPEDVSRGDDRYLSTNHLVGFALAHGEAVWCFDVTQGQDGNYPVYYHHQDEPRARYAATGEWEEPEYSAPDFDSFAHWLATMVVGLTDAEPAEWFELIGIPGITFTDVRPTLP